MNKKDEALRLALEALENLLNEYYADTTTRNDLEKAEAAIDALRERLAQPEQSYPDNFIDALKYDVALRDSEAARQRVVEHAPCRGMNCGITRTDQEHSLECQAEHAAAIAGGEFVKSAQQQDYWQEEARRYSQNADFWRSKYESATAQQQEPFGWVVEHKHGGKCFSQTMAGVYTDTAVKVTTVYTSPPQRKPLTDEEIWKNDAIMSANSGYGASFDTLREMVRAIEAAHNITGEQHG